jgi:hypothetical protein
MVKAIPIVTGLPGSESYALNVNGDLYDMGRVEVMPSRVILNQPRRPPE